MYLKGYMAIFVSEHVYEAAVGKSTKVQIQIQSNIQIKTQIQIHPL